MFELKPIARHLVLACGGLASALMLAGPAGAQQQQQQAQEQKLERVTITGSNIRRTDTETVSPVEIITREEIEKSGRTTVAEVLASIPSNTGGLFNETANSFAPGSSTVSLRGLGQAATLVLVNGRRMASYGFAQNIQDSFVDLNSIPASAVERIEILKDGASAIYGSDAIAGVVNVILRRDYKGIEASAGARFFESSKQEYRAQLTMGFGDLGADRFNVFAAFDFLTRDGMTMADTEFGRTRDYRGVEGGRNFQSLTQGGTWTTGFVGAPNPNLRRAYAECPNVVNFQQALAIGLLPPSFATVPLGTGLNQPGNTWCVRDVANALQIIPDSDRVGVLSRATFDLSAETQLYAEAGFSRVESKFIFTEPFFAGTTRFFPVPAPVNLAPSPFNATFAPGVSGNPLGVNARYVGQLNDFGTRDTEVTSDALRLLVGAKYRAFNWDLESGLGYAESKVEQNSKVLLTSGTIAALGLPTTLQPPTPVVTGGATYNLDRPSTNSAALRSQMFGTVTRDAKSDLQFIDTKASTETSVMLPGGPIAVALGAEYRKESIKSIPTDLVRNGGVLGQGSTLVDGSRNSFAGYTEFALPLTRALEAQAALRFDNYSDFGSTVNPKLGMKFKPAPEFLLRANWGRGFKAPSLPEITPSSAFFFTLIEDPLAPGVLSQIAGSINANPNLKPEKSRSSTIGFVFEPTPNFSVGIDAYEIKRTNQVSFEDFQVIADTPGDPRAFRDPVTGFILSIAGSYTNLGETFTRGVDFDVRQRSRTTVGVFTSRLSATYLDTFQVNGEETAGSNAAWLATNTGSLPRWKATYALDFERGASLVTVRANYIHSFDRDYGIAVASSFFRNSTATENPQTGRLSRKQPSYTTWDLVGRYNVTPSLTVSASVINVTDELPPFDPSFSTTYFYDRTQSYDIRGRYYGIGVRYKFM